MRTIRCAQNADETTSAASMGHAQIAPQGSTAVIQPSESLIEMPSSDTRSESDPSAKFGSTGGVIAQDGTCLPNSTNSVGNLSTSTRRYRQPSTALQLAAQASAVATKLLNGEIDLEVARAYGTLARTAAQAMGVEVQTGRFLKTKTSLGMDTDTVMESEAAK